MAHHAVTEEAGTSPGPAVTPPTMTSHRHRLLAQLRQEESGEDTEHVIDWLTDAWETLDLLIERFGSSRAFQLYTAQDTNAQGACCADCP